MAQTERSPEERREAFCREYIANGGKIYHAAVHAGFPAASASVRGNELMKRSDVQERLAELLRERFVTEGVKAHQVVLALSKRSSQKDAVKLRAAKELMTLGGLFKKADAAEHARDAEKRSQAELVGMCQEFAAGMLRLFCLESPGSGHQTGIKFVDGAYTIVNAERAGEHLTNLYRGWTEKIPAKYGAGQTPNLYHSVHYEVPAEPEPVETTEDEDEDWTAA
jgi:hypothetical protein